MLKDRILKISDFFRTMNVDSTSNIIYVLVEFQKGWACSELTEPNFNVSTVRENDTQFYFFAHMDVGFEKIFDAIDYNIKFNQDAQVKVELLKEKISLLKNIFEEEDITVLRTLEFKYKKKKQRNNKNKSNNDSNNNDNNNQIEEDTNVSGGVDE
jgi:hypothetical protein